MYKDPTNNTPQWCQIIPCPKASTLFVLLLFWEVKKAIVHFGCEEFLRSCFVDITMVVLVYNEYYHQDDNMGYCIQVTGLLVSAPFGTAWCQCASNFTFGKSSGCGLLLIVKCIWLMPNYPIAAITPLFALGIWNSSNWIKIHISRWLGFQQPSLAVS